jgi:hypothetical protein
MRHSALAGLLSLGAALCSLACGSSDQTRASRAEPADQSLNVEQDFNVCPYFESSVILPQTIAPGQTAAVIVRAVDPDGDDALLAYEWSVSAGELTEVDGPSIAYSCTDTGAQILTVVAKDARGCHSTLDIAVTCLER